MLINTGQQTIAANTTVATTMRIQRRIGKAATMRIQRRIGKVATMSIQRRIGTATNMRIQHKWLLQLTGKSVIWVSAGCTVLTANKVGNGSHSWSVELARYSSARAVGDGIGSSVPLCALCEPPLHCCYSRYICASICILGGGIPGQD